jgi:4-hydroxy-4-methyl-2-oxoglutarate aldolase
MQAVDPQVLARLQGVRAANVSDALERRGLTGACEGLRPVGGGARLVGPAFTVRYIPTGSLHGTVGDYIDDVPAGHVVVLDNAGRLDRSVWGYCLTRVAKSKGVAGTVIDGMCRDVPVVLEEQYAVFSRGACILTGKDHYMLQAAQVPVSLGRIQVNPGDVIVADDSGVVVVPVALAADVAADAEAIQRAEEACVEAFRRGIPLWQARQLHGYHTLQSRPAQDGTSRSIQGRTKGIR